ncbi:urease accessory protein UreD [Thermosynechococcus sp. HN-54]|uniref:urease accessory protein UreD n=1 Tax=Thermosynechococcus sp. HN-54 TaxID=2933959 RepID=UPI00202CEB53|nr:urease accessory protein UreD [Thermosynechococcus sp. HN-54]URR34897.1 urease accessory protein UreD [Thermosynechococcus sp. HN-54]
MAGWLGELELAYAWQQGQTIPVRAYASAPLKLQRSFYPEGRPICHSVILHTAGGYVGGDRLHQKIRLDPQCRALLTTAAAAKIYGRAQTVVEQTIHCHIANEAVLEWLPQETIVFDGAQFCQRLRIDLDPSAQVCLWEMTRFGRTARGEAFSRGYWRSHTEVWQAGVPLWLDRQRIEGTTVRLTAMNALQGCPLMGTLAWVGREVSGEQIQRLRDLATGIQGEMGVSALIRGVVCRYRGHSMGELRHWFVAAWQMLRQAQDASSSPCYPRVWPR